MSGARVTPSALFVARGFWGVADAMVRLKAGRRAELPKTSAGPVRSRMLRPWNARARTWMGGGEEDIGGGTCLWFRYCELLMNLGEGGLKNEIEGGRESV